MGELLTEFPLVHQIQSDADLVFAIIYHYGRKCGGGGSEERQVPVWAPRGRQRSWEDWRRGSSGSFASSVHSPEAPQQLAWMADMEFVQNFTPPDFQAKNFTPSISPNLNSFSKKKHKK